MKADFSKIINNSIKITKNNKRLWVFGLVIASLGAGANFSSLSNLGDVFKEKDNQQANTVIDQSIDQSKDLNNQILLNSNLLTSKFPQVLGTATTSLTGLLKTIPYSFYGFLALLILTTGVTFTAVALYGRAWSVSGLIHGIEREQAGESVSLMQMSAKGKTNAIEVIKISILPGLVFAIILILSALIIIIPMLLLGDVGKVVGVLLGVIWLIAIVVASITIGGSITLGILAINLESLNWKTGFSKGFKIFKKYVVDYFVLSIINCFAGCIFGLVSLVGLVVLGGIGAASVVGAIAFPPFMIAAGPIVFLAFLAIIMFMGVIGTVSVVFTQSTWVLLYKQLTEETNGQR